MCWKEQNNTYRDLGYVTLKEENDEQYERKMHTGELYLPGDTEIMEDQTKRLDRLYDYNKTRPTEGKKREALLIETCQNCMNCLK